MTRKKAPVPSSGRIIILAVIALFFALYAAWAGWKIIDHTQRSTAAIEKILTTYNMKNEGAQTLEKFDNKNPFLGFLLGSTVKKTLKLPSEQHAEEELTSGIEKDKKEVRNESSIAAWWSWSLLSASFAYVVLMIALERRHNSRPVLFALTTISLTFFIIGIFAPAMVIWTAPVIHLNTGDLSFVVQYQIRGIAAIIWDLLTADHWIIGGFLLLFSIVTPLTKASLTYVALFSHSKELNVRIGNFLHSIGKWSMADVFVAAILLALYALKFQQATRSIPCLGLYYFIGYCMVALTTTQLMIGSEVMSGEGRSQGELGLKVIGGLLAGLLCFLAASSRYTYLEYTQNTKEKVTAGTPQKLNNSDFVLPVHK